jgi:hypothetical protein
MFHSKVDFLNYLVCYGCGGCRISFIFKPLHLFSFILYSHLKTTGIELVLKHVITVIKLLFLQNIFSEYLIDHLTNSFHILTQRFVLFFNSVRARHKFYVCDCVENSTLLGQPQAHETIKIQPVVCQSVCYH